MERLIITAQMASPLILGGGYFTLDALLAGILFEIHEDVETAHAAIPLNKTDGLYHASAALFEVQQHTRKTFVANLRAKHSLDPDLIKKGKNGKLHRKITEGRPRDFGPVLNTYREYGAQEVTWYCEGDQARIEELLTAGAHFIGKRRASGFGEVRGWEISVGDLDGVMDGDGYPLRPVPEHLYDGNKDALRVDAGWRPAYWHPLNRAICYAPRPN